MGRAKADLPFGSETLLERVVRILLEAVDEVVVVHAADQSVPRFDDRVTTAQDPIPFGGPLIGLQAGLNCAQAMPDPPEIAYLTSCDSPFLGQDFVREILRQLQGYDVAVPKGEKYYFPLAAAYHSRVLSSINDLIIQGERRPRALFDVCNTLPIPTDSLRSIDPELDSLVNLNAPENYRDALSRASLPIPAWLEGDD